MKEEWIGDKRQVNKVEHLNNLGITLARLGFVRCFGVEVKRWIDDSDEDRVFIHNDVYVRVVDLNGVVTCDSLIMRGSDEHA